MLVLKQLITFNKKNKRHTSSELADFRGYSLTTQDLGIAMPLLINEMPITIIHPKMSLKYTLHKNQESQSVFSQEFCVSL